MPVKESSDELNPPVVTGVALPARARGGERGPSDFLALALATCGVGYLPIAPGTWGSLVGVALFLLFRRVALEFIAQYAGAHGLIPAALESLYRLSLLALIMCVTAGGVWAATRAESLLGRKDPGAVVIDEVAGQLIAFLFIPPSVEMKWWLVLAGFLLFRVFDIWKPYPVRRLEALNSGLGIMADDVLAGIYAAACLLLLMTLYLLS
jgi:phosphatidylglycerophosphatase A